ncbi:MAG: lytic transglycosylase domain-containing protein [Endomicrobiales bacterium]|jgi:hypothetical protein
MHFIVALFIIVYSACACGAAPGKLFLKNGQYLVGDIRTSASGKVWFSRHDGSIEFDRSEIKRIVLSSRRDTVNETFLWSLKITSSAGGGTKGLSTPFETIIRDESLKNNLDPALVKAVIKAESNFNPSDRSCKGACGLMQLMPNTARLLGVRNIYSPKENIGAGARFLKDMMTTFHGSIDKALAAYNAGPSVVQHYNRIPPFRETQKYVRDVSRYYENFRDPGSVLSYVDDTGCLNLYNVH